MYTITYFMYIYIYDCVYMYIYIYMCTSSSFYTYPGPFGSALHLGRRCTLRPCRCARGVFRAEDRRSICSLDHIVLLDIWPWVNTNYHQNWVGEHPNKDYYIHSWDVHQGYRVLTHTHM